MNSRDSIAESAQEAQRIAAIRQELERRNVHVLAGHDFNRPLGSMLAGNARVIDGDDAIRFEVDLPDPADQPSWMADTVRSVRAGLAGGISPGFRVPRRHRPSRMRRSLVPEPGNPGVIDPGQINQAVLFELSVVSAARHFPRPRLMSGRRTSATFPTCHRRRARCGCNALTADELRAALRLGDTRRGNSAGHRDCLPTPSRPSPGTRPTRRAVIHNEAVYQARRLLVRSAHGHERGGVRERAQEFSGAAAILLPYRVHRAGAI